ncbi:hypothetical protein Pcac1_g22814 [Phytophthora cactorum]|nr:hypothetical protein Pcac1_g22814 [Phytophthora cactorum]
MENPQEEHWVAVKRIFRYLQGTKTHGICFKPGDNIDFRGYSDADWAGDLADRKSTSGYTFMLMGAPVSWGRRSSKVFRGPRTTTSSRATSLSGLMLPPHGRGTTTMLVDDCEEAWVAWSRLRDAVAVVRRRLRNIYLRANFF